ncbi:MAG: 5-methylthioadenosine/S-adenosylhomocysteine deaminase [Chloroflexota bacterium]|nr:5-methylthioadenosine/S-adenosylhomocysteine deaminase [Chloroflexota bacterium]
MQKIDLILKNAIVLTMDKDLHQYTPGALAVKGDSIAAVGLEKDILSEYSAEEVKDCGGKVLMPGLINTHTHIPMTMLRGLADDLRLDVWLLGYMMPVEREFVSPEFVALGTKIGCAESIRTGITCMNDMYYYEDTIARTIADIGLRAVCSETIMKFPTPDARSYEEALEMMRRFAEEFKDHPLVIPSVAPHAPYTCPPEILKACTELALEYDIPLHIHISETKEEVEDMRRDNGMPVVPYTKKQGVFEAKTIAAHCVHIDEGEIRTLEHADVGVAHNPSSNMKLASGIAPVKAMLDLGLKVGIGTDGTASNNDLDFFEEMRLATFLAKGSSGDPTAVPAVDTLVMATRMGAEAMHIDHLTGSLEVGKRADLILFNLATIHNSPAFRHDPNGVYSQIVYAGKATDVTDMLVNGKWIMLDHVIPGIDEKALIEESQVIAAKIDKFIVKREKSILSKLIAIGGATQEESFEVQTKVAIEDPAPIVEMLESGTLKILRTRHYHEYDTYLYFEDKDEGRLRFREDHFIEKNGKISQVRSRLTLIGATREHHFPQEVMLSRSRFIAPADQSLRFYREYFKPVSETEVEKDRLRYLIEYKGEEFFINIDEIKNPALGFFLEVKARTWSEKDAEEKSLLIADLIKTLGAAEGKKIVKDYIEIVEAK